MKRLIRQAWEKYEAAMPTGVTPTERREMRRAFYHGVISLLAISRAQHLEIDRELDRELDEYRFERAGGRA